MSGSPWIRKGAVGSTTGFNGSDVASPYPQLLSGKPFVTVTADPNGVADFGPFTPGTTTSGIAEAINFAANNASSLTGCYVRLFQGNFSITGNIPLPPIRVEIQGSGKSVTALNFTAGTQGFVISASDQNDKAFEDFTWNTDGTASAFITDNATTFTGQILFIRRCSVNNTSTTPVPLTTGTIANAVFTEVEIFAYVNVVLGKTGIAPYDAHFFNCFLNQLVNINCIDGPQTLTFHGGETDSTVVMSNGSTINLLAYIGTRINPSYSSAATSPVYLASGSATIQALFIGGGMTSPSASSNFVSSGITVTYLFADPFINGNSATYPITLPSPSRVVNFQSQQLSDLSGQTTNSTSYVIPTNDATISITPQFTGQMRVRAIVRVSNGNSGDSVTAGIFNPSTAGAALDSDTYVQDASANDRTFVFDYYLILTVGAATSFAIKFKVSAGTGTITIVRFQVDEYGC